uniref:HNH nuclease domain-containing protein n=1 Tax=uncultured marine virus TaxID=186617 RepID=A0A0F7LBU9_9VIRU|nr:hypothetical protein [uncultured marine virus]
MATARSDKSLCSSCSVALTAKNAYSKKGGYQGLDSKCKPCKKAYATRWNKVNDRTEILRKSNFKRKDAIAHSKHKRRVQKNKIELTYGETLFVREYFKTAQSLYKETGVKYEVDHIIPLCQGGLHAPWNLQLLTQFENRSKGGR